MKRILSVLLIIIILSFNNTFALVNKSNDIYLTDEASIITENNKDYILKISNYLHNKKGIDYYVVTINSLENYDLESYGEYIYKAFNISEKGLLILFSKSDRIIYIKAGQELSTIINDEMINEYIDLYFMPDFEKGKYNEGIKNGYSAFLKYICSYYNIDSSNIEVYGEKNFIDEYKIPLILFIIWICTLIGYIFSSYFVRFFKSNNISIINYIVFSISVVVNIVLLALAYLIEPLLIIVVLGFELVAIYSNLNTEEIGTKINRKKRRKR